MQIMKRCNDSENPYEGLISVVHDCDYGAPFVKILYLTGLVQKPLSLRINSCLCTYLIISAQR